MTGLLRAGLLDGHRIALAGVGEQSDAIASCCTGLGADVLAAPASDADALVCDGGALFAGSSAGVDALRACADGSFDAVSALARELIAAERPGRFVLLAPPPGAGPHADAARAALENLARTLSVEWSGRAITIVAVVPGDDTPAHELAQVVAFLLSDGGDYCTGTLLDLRELARSDSTESGS